MLGEFGIIAFGVISGVNAIYQLVFRQDIVLFIVNAIVGANSFYTWLNRDNPDQLKKIESCGRIWHFDLHSSSVFRVIMNHFLGLSNGSRGKNPWLNGRLSLA